MDTISIRSRVSEPPFPLSVDTSRSSSPSSRFLNTLLLCYDTNLWRRQMARRFPAAKLIGVARLRHWRWQINERGVANMVESAPPPYSPATARWLGPLMGGDGSGREDNERVYGTVYELGPGDEERLDAAMDKSHSKQSSWVELWSFEEQGGNHKVDILKRARRAKVVFQVDRDHTTDAKGKCSPSIAYRMTQGAHDLADMGVPKGYLDECVRSFLPTTDSSDAKLAVQQAMLMGVDVKQLVDQVEEELAAALGDETAVPPGEDGLRKFLQKIVPEANGRRGRDEFPGPRSHRAMSSI
jgi:gamma-glutamylcyclotransferase